MLMLVSSAARMSEEEVERASTQTFILPGKVIQAEWHKSSSLDENINRNFNGQNNFRAKQQI